MDIYEIAKELDKLLEQTVVEFGMAARGFLVNSQRLRVNLLRLEKLGKLYRKASVDFEAEVREKNAVGRAVNGRINKKAFSYKMELTVSDADP